eukprot:1385870-Prorocentrum_lima.AAC.1
MACRALLESAPSVDVGAEMLAVRSDYHFLSWTALHRAARGGHETASRVMLEFAPNPQVQ